MEIEQQNAIVYNKPMAKATKKHKKAIYKAIKKYNNSHTRNISVRFHLERDKKYLDFLDSVSNKSQFLRDAIDLYLSKDKNS